MAIFFSSSLKHAVEEFRQEGCVPGNTREHGIVLKGGLNLKVGVFAAEAVIYEIDHFNGFLYAVIQQRGNILGVCGLVVPGQEPFVYGLRSDNRYRGGYAAVSGAGIGPRINILGEGFETRNGYLIKAGLYTLADKLVTYSVRREWFRRDISRPRMRFKCSGYRRHISSRSL